ncbi:hypothetical protein [Kitasatospora sp. NE20-6]
MYAYGRVERCFTASVLRGTPAVTILAAEVVLYIGVRLRLGPLAAP